MFKRAGIILLGIALGMTPAAWADESLFQTAGKVLQLGVGARAVGMGEAQVAATEDLYAVYWNPAGLSKIRNTQISYMHNLWLADIQDAYICYGQSLMDGGMGVSLNYINFGEFEKMDADANGYPIPLGQTFNPYTMIISGGVGYPVLPTLDVGGTVKLVSESVDTFNTMTMAADLGLQMTVAKGFRLGLMMQNLGLPIEGYRLPLNIKLGTSYRLPLVFDQRRDRCVLVADFNGPLPFDESYSANLGLEYWYAGTVAARLGYKIAEINNRGDMAGLAAGIGVHYRGFKLDYAFTPMGDLGSTHRISLTYGFNAPKKKTQRIKTIKRRTMTRPTGQTQAGQATGGAVGDALDDMMLPSLDKYAMRKPIRVDVKATVDPKEKTRVEKAVFRFTLNLDKAVKRWGLKLMNARGEAIRGFSGEGNPPTLSWDGNDREGRAVKESIFSMYEFEVLMKDGSVEKLNGKVVEKAEEAQEEVSGSKQLPSIYFRESSSDLTEEALEILKDAAEKIKSRPYVKITVEGYTDGGNEKTGDFLLSQRRAETVTRYLTATYKIPLKGITVHARGSKQPAASNQTEDGRAKNRRVEIIIIYKR